MCTRFLRFCLFMFLRVVLSARRYATAVLAVFLCPSVCLSHGSRCVIKTAGWITLVFTHRLPSAYRTLLHKGICVPSKTRVLSSVTLSPNSGLKKISPRNVRRPSQVCCQLSSTDEHWFIALSVHRCVQHHGLDDRYHSMRQCSY